MIHGHSHIHEPVATMQPAIYNIKYLVSILYLMIHQSYAR